jgi:hypothetical protein
MVAVAFGRTAREALERGQIAYGEPGGYDLVVVTDAVGNVICGTLPPLQVKPRMSFVVDAPLFACLFNRPRNKYVGMHIGVIAKVTSDHVESGGVEFRIADGTIFDTLEAAEARAVAMNAQPLETGSHVEI